MKKKNNMNPFKRKKVIVDVRKSLPICLNENEILSFTEWINSLPIKYRKKDICFHFSSGNGIGIGISVICGNKSCDITDYSRW